MNVLFVCSRNKWRSKTAEEIYRNHNSINVRSVGTEPSAQRKLSEKDIVWADIIFVMERKHKQRINERFGAIANEKEIITMEIEDNYLFMDPELIEEIKSIADPVFKMLD
jgi:protein-tyrosine phosphatase